MWRLTTHPMAVVAYFLVDDCWRALLNGLIKSDQDASRSSRGVKRRPAKVKRRFAVGI
jgi:hypothetical protein